MKKPINFDWWLTGFCFSRAFVALVFMTYSAALPVLQKEWEMSASAAGSISSGFHMGFAISLLIFSILADRIGPKSLYVGSMTGAAIFSLVFSFFARDYYTGFCLYTLVALSLGGTYTTGLIILADQYPVQRRGMAVGFFIASSSFGYGASLLISGIALPIGGYKLSFLLTCLGPFAGAILAWITLAKVHTKAEKRQKEQRFVKEVLKNRPAMLLIGGYMFHCWELLGLWAWTPKFLSNCLAICGTESIKAAGIGSSISGSFHLIGLFASFLMGTLSDRYDRAHVIIALAGMSTLCSFVFGWSIGWPMIAVIGLGLIYAFTSFGDSPVLSTALTEVVETSYLGSAYGLRSLFGFGAGGISPLVFGAILDWTNPMAPSPLVYSTWGWAYVTLGLGGLAAVWCGCTLARIHKFKKA